MNNNEIKDQQYFQSLEHALRYIRSGERLSLEASLEELCKVLLLQVCIERESKFTMGELASDLWQTEEDVTSFYQRCFKSLVPGHLFKEWEVLKIRKTTLVKVVEELTDNTLSDGELLGKAKAFTEFLQVHYSGYLSEYSTPQKLNSFIVDVLDAKRMSSLLDPCCGLCGALVEAVSRSTRISKLKGVEINNRIINTARLHMMLYGFDPDCIECDDILNYAKPYVMDQYDYVIAHLPQVHQAFSIAGRRNLQNRYPFKSFEDCLISQILKLLRPEGIAALVVSDELLESDTRIDSRNWLFKNSQIMNITKFEGLSYATGGNSKSYNVIFLKRTNYPSLDVSSSAYISIKDKNSNIKEIATSIKEDIYAPQTVHSNKGVKYFSLLNRHNWNITLLYLQDKIGVNYPAVPLAEILHHERVRINIVDDELYSQLTVRNKGLGVVRRGKPVKGVNLPKDARYEARSGQLIVSSIEASRGAIGIVPKELNRSVVTRNYYLFTLDTERVRPDYLSLVLCTEPIMQQMSSLNKREYSWSRITLEKTLSVVIPLPDLEEQDRISKAMMKQVKKIQKAQEELEEEQTIFCKELFGE